MSSNFVELNSMEAKNVQREESHQKKMDFRLMGQPIPQLEVIRALVTEKRRVLIRALLGEFLATFIFLFSVMSTGVNLKRIQGGKAEAGSVETVGALTTAFVAVAVIYSFADVSGAHFNPAVTFATMVMGKTSWKKGVGYMIMQLLAAICATGFLLVVYTRENAESSVVQFYSTEIYKRSAFATEFILSFILVYVIFAVAFDTVDSSNTVKVDLPKPTDEEALVGDAEAEAVGKQLQDLSKGRNLTIYTTSGSSKAGFAPIAIGFTLGFLCFLGGSTSGGAFNPARVFGPSLIFNNWDNHWVYWVGDFTGAAFAGLLQSFFAHKPSQSAAAAVNTAK